MVLCMCCWLRRGSYDLGKGNGTFFGRERMVSFFPFFFFSTDQGHVYETFAFVLVRNLELGLCYVMELSGFFFFGLGFCVFGQWGGNGLGWGRYCLTLHPAVECGNGELIDY